MAQKKFHAKAKSGSLPIRHRDELSMTPFYCPQCRLAGIIATVNGPTCTHHNHGTGVAWFPAWWEPNRKEQQGFDFDERRMVRMRELNAPVTSPNAEG